MYKTSSQIAHEVLVKLAAAEDPGYVGANALGLGLMGAGVGAFGSRLGGSGPAGTLLGTGLGAGLGTLLGARAGLNQRDRLEGKAAPSIWHEDSPVGTGELYGGGIGAGAAGGIAFAEIAPAMARAADAGRFGKYVGLGVIPLAATLGGGLLGSAYGAGFDHR